MVIFHSYVSLPEGKSSLGTGDLVAKKSVITQKDLRCERQTELQCQKELPEGFSQTWQRGSLTSEKIIAVTAIYLGKLW
jgi:hypothetical protein